MWHNFVYFRLREGSILGYMEVITRNNSNSCKKGTLPAEMIKKDYKLIEKLLIIFYRKKKQLWEAAVFQ